MKLTSIRHTPRTRQKIITDPRIVELGNANIAKIMAAVQPIVRREFEEGRITDDAYATVYLGALQSVIEVAYTAPANEERLKLDAEMMDAQIEGEDANTALKRAQEISVLSETGIKEEQNEKQLELFTAEAALKKEQAESLRVSVADNRKIKTIDSFGSVIGMGLSANVKIPENLYAGYFGVVHSLLGTNYA